MSLQAPQSWTAQIALGAAIAFAGCLAVGYLSGPASQKAKKQARQQAASPQMGGEPQMSAAERKLERLFKSGEQLLQAGNIASAELAYIEALDNVQELPEPQVAAFLESILSTRVAITCERQGKYEEAEKYLLRAIASYESRTLAPQELPEYAEVLEKAVELCMTKLNNPEKAVRPLTLWLKLGEEMSSDQIILVCSNLLGNIKARQEKYEEAEAHCKRVITLMSKKGTLKHDELSATTMLNLSNIFYNLDKHEENKKLIADITAFLGGLGVMTAATGTGSLAETVFDFGYFPEALAIFTRALEHCSRSLVTADEIAHFENCIAETLAEMGKLDEAKEKLRRIAASLAHTSPPLTVSTFFDTKDAVVVEENGAAVVSVNLVARPAKKKKPLPSTAVLVGYFEHPEDLHPAIEQEQASGPNVEFRVEIPFARKGYYIAHFDVYSDATKAQKISTHIVLTQCESDINVPIPVSLEAESSSTPSTSEPAPVESSSSSIPESEVPQASEPVVPVSEESSKSEDAIIAEVIAEVIAEEEAVAKAEAAAEVVADAIAEAEAIAETVAETVSEAVAEAVEEALEKIEEAVAAAEEAVAVAEETAAVAEETVAVAEEIAAEEKAAEEPVAETL